MLTGAQRCSLQDIRGEIPLRMPYFPQLQAVCENIIVFFSPDALSGERQIIEAVLFDFDPEDKLIVLL